VKGGVTRLRAIKWETYAFEGRRGVNTPQADDKKKKLLRKRKKRGVCGGGNRGDPKKKRQFGPLVQNVWDEGGERTVHRCLVKKQKGEIGNFISESHGNGEKCQSLVSRIQWLGGNSAGREVLFVNRESSRNIREAESPCLQHFGTYTSKKNAEGNLK